MEEEKRYRQFMRKESAQIFDGLSEQEITAVAAGLFDLAAGVESDLRKALDTKDPVVLVAAAFKSRDVLTEFLNDLTASLLLGRN